MVNSQPLELHPAQTALPDSTAMIKEQLESQPVLEVTTPLALKTNSASPVPLGLLVPRARSRLAALDNTRQARPLRAASAPQANTVQPLIKARSPAPQAPTKPPPVRRPAFRALLGSNAHPSVLRLLTAQLASTVCLESLLALSVLLGMNVHPLLRFLLNAPLENTLQLEPLPAHLVQQEMNVQL